MLYTLLPRWVSALFQAAFYSDVRAWLLAAWDSVSRLWNFELLAVESSSITLKKVVLAVILVTVGISLSRWISRRLERKVLPRLGLTHGAAHAIQVIVFYILIAFFALFALKLVHIPLTIFTVIGGALAIGVGFGSQNVVNNFISGLILLIEQPIRPEDIVEFSGMRGTVKRIGARSTIITTPENLDIIVPNSALLENSIVNWTLRDNKVRRNVKVGVAYGTSTRRVEELLHKLVLETPKILREPAAEVFLSDFGDNALLFEVRFWIELRQLSEALEIESEIRHRIAQRFQEAGISIPFPQRDLYLKPCDTALKVEVLGSR